MLKCLLKCADAHKRSCDSYAMRHDWASASVSGLTPPAPRCTDSPHAYNIRCERGKKSGARLRPSGVQGLRAISSPTKMPTGDRRGPIDSRLMPSDSQNLKANTVETPTYRSADTQHTRGHRTARNGTGSATRRPNCPPTLQSLPD